MAREYEDILIDVDSELIIKDGDLQIGNSLDQEVGLILMLNQGELKNAPLLGANLTSLMKSTDPERVKRRIKLHLEADGKQVGKIELTGTTVKIDAQQK